MEILICPTCKGSLIKDGFCGGKQKYECKNCGKKTVYPINTPDAEIIEQNVKLAKNNQLHSDKNRVLNKSWRSYVQFENTLVELNKELIEILKEKNFSKLVKLHKVDNEECVLVVSLSDLHFNELVTDVIGNSFDFIIASKRLKLFAEKIKRVCTVYNIKSIVVTMLGDLMNSDRRLSEVTSQANNRSRSTFFAVDILKSFLLDLNDIANLTVFSVTGNESRVDQEIGWNNVVASNNFDTIIFNILKLLFKNNKGIQFVDGDPSEQVIKISNSIFLIMHGNNIRSANGTHTEIQKIVGKFANKGINVDYSLIGHYHSAHISDTFSRSSSLVGANEYSEKCLNLASKSSQNVFIVHKNKELDCIRFGLQNIDNVTGYEIDDVGDAYNSKSKQKSYENTQIYHVK